MKYHPLLEGLAKWQNEEHFFSERYHWWKQWAVLSGKELTVDLLEQDEFRTPTTTTDFKTGQTIQEISTFSFSYNLGFQIDREFKKLHKEIQDKLIILEKESQKKSFIAIIGEELEILGKKVNELNIKDMYKEVILEKFQTGKDSVKNLLIEESSILEHSWDFKYKHIVQGWGKANLNQLVEELVSKSWLSGSEENLKNFRSFFSGKTPKDIIIWTGRMTYLKTFIHHIVQKELVETRNHWIAIENSFVVIHNKQRSSTKGIRNTNITKSEKTNITIKKLVDLLVED